MSIKSKLAQVANACLRPLGAQIVARANGQPAGPPPAAAAPPDLTAAVMANPALAAKFFPYQQDRNTYVLLRAEQDVYPDVPEVRGAPPFPMPPNHLWIRSSPNPRWYLASGRQDVETVRRLVAASGLAVESCRRVLDFGCASGRMVRWWHDLAGACEVWGVDMVDELILWCQQHLSPPFKFATVTSFPHLPFADGFFDLVYGYSVFTHIADLSDAWLLELGRVVRSGGRLYLTVQDEHTYDLVTTPGTVAEWKPSKQQAEGIHDLEAHYANLRAEFAKFVVDRAPGPGHPGQAQVYYHSAYLRKHWGSYFDVLSITPEAFGFQTAVVLGKR